MRYSMAGERKGDWGKGGRAYKAGKEGGNEMAMEIEKR